MRIPRRYLDFSRHVSILEAAVNDTVTISCVIDRINLKRPRPHLSIVEMYVTDTIGIMRISFFRQPWLAKAYHVGDVVALLGKVEYSYGFKCMNSPFIELIHAADTRPTDGHAADTRTPMHKIRVHLSFYPMPALIRIFFLFMHCATAYPLRGIDALLKYVCIKFCRW